MNLQVYRTQLSAYQPPEFALWEKKHLETLPGVSYVNQLSELDPNLPYAVITNSNTEVTKIPQAIWNNTAILIHPNSGHDNIPHDWAQTQHFPIVAGHPIRAQAVSEYILSSLFEMFTELPEHSFWDSKRQWNRPLLKDQKILVMGHGHIGPIVSQTLQALGCEVIIFDPYAYPEGPTQIDDQLNTISVIIICSSLTPSSKHFFNLERLKSLPEKAYLINSARGGIIDEQALAILLPQRPHWKVRLDVFEKEPFVPGLFEEFSQVKKTSHIAGVWEGIDQKILDYELQILREFLVGKEQKTLKSFYKKYKKSIINVEKFL